MTQIFEIDYTNYRGERSFRRIRPTGLYFKSSPYHPQMQWTVTALDMGKEQFRDFTVAGLHRWEKFTKLEDIIENIVAQVAFIMHTEWPPHGYAWRCSDDRLVETIALTVEGVRARKERANGV